MKNGVSEAQFDHWHRQDQAEASQEWQAMGERDRQEFCRELRYCYHHE